MADLQTMRSAEAAASFLWRDRLPEEPVEYWFEPATIQLIPISEPMPASYGAGTRRNGRAVKVFEDQTGTSYAYSGREDYTDKILHVLVSNEDGDLHVSMDWVPNR